jgi:hypothetical protein
MLPRDPLDNNASHPGAPAWTTQALRAVLVDGCSQKDVAERYGFLYDAFRHQVNQFRAVCASGKTPPFLHPGHAADRL